MFIQIKPWIFSLYRYL